MGWVTNLRKSPQMEECKTGVWQMGESWGDGGVAAKPAILRIQWVNSQRGGSAVAKQPSRKFRRTVRIPSAASRYFAGLLVA